ncbi:MAG TPA: ABC transporter substrate-binding protein [Candidatus Atopostipes pullistercoris]|uniref:ABC transporter substrate-binding protein n=1 Tax=Candidatus Atopostipes pullistercoris TaxID=2838467 RepID=A0A9D2G1T5_9LACT|nr:ABC transporter substrate-binding protein [Candidatus Atopostipes pullistercoris]
MDRTKKMFGGVLLSASLLLAACGNKGATNEEINEGADGETVEITFWHAMNGPNQEAITNLTDEFNDSQDTYYVKEQNQGDYDTLNQSIIAGGASQTLPTMSQLTPGDVPNLANDGLLLSLDDLLISEDGFTQEQLDDIYDGFLSSSVYNDEMYAIPFSKSTRVMYYNQDLLDEYGVDVPKTWDEVITLGEMMVDAGDDAVAMGLENAYEMEFETMARQNGSSFISEDLEVAIDSPESVEALKFITDMIDKGYARTAGEDGFFSGPFGRGESALYIGSSAGTPHVAPVAEENNVNWSTAELPTYNNEQLTLFAGNDLGIFASASEEEAQGAIAFMAFLLQPENTAQWAIDTGYVPVTESGVNTEEYQTYLEENPVSKAATLELDYGISSPIFIGHSEYRNYLIDTLEEVLINDLDEEEALMNINTTTEEIISSNN